jgi:DNA invertase Pin-like site-specific DNA recombinase
MNYAVYYRVSTRQQGLDGYGMDAQKRLCEAYVASVQGTITGEFIEVESGKKCNRKEALAAIAFCQRTGATLVMSKVDRILRNIKFLCVLRDSGIKFYILENPSCDSFALVVLCGLAEREAVNCSMRTKAGLQSAKLKGVKLGSPCLEVARKRAVGVLKANAVTFAQSVYPYILEARADKKGRWKTLADFGQYLKLKDVKTARGLTDWTPTTVRNIIKICEKTPVSVNATENLSNNEAISGNIS